MRSAGGVALCALAAAAGGAVALTRESYAMVCEVAQSCAVPVLDDGSSRGDLQGVHTHTFEVDEHSTTSFSSDQMTLRTSLIERRAFNATAVGQWLITYTSGSGASAKEVDVFITNEDNTKPTISVCGHAVESTDAQKLWLPCMDTTAFDHADGDITASIVATMRLPSGADVPFTAAQAGEMYKTPGKYVIHYSVVDAAGHAGSATKVVHIVDDSIPLLSVNGANPTVVECGSGVFADEGAVGHDMEDGTVTAKAYGGYRRSCKEILESFPESKSGPYTITFTSNVDNQQHTHEVFCDMETDGGGYTYLPVTDAAPVSRDDGSRLSTPNTCHTHGMQIAVFRTDAQVRELVAKYGAQFVQTVGGVYGTVDAVGKSMAAHKMNSADPTASSLWKATDGGSWFVRSTPFAEPSGNYQAGCLLGITDYSPLQVNDDECNYSTGPKYVCSTNDKGGPGVLPALTFGELAKQPGFPPAVPGAYNLMYAAMDSQGNTAVPAERRVWIRDLTPPTVALKGPTAIVQHIGPNDPWVLNDPGATCTDACDHTINSINATWNDAFNPNALGRWTRHYICTDQSGNTATTTRHFYLVAKEDPVLTLRGEDPITIESKKGVQFLDEGATCVDGVGKDISSNVIAYGEVVNMGVPGTYLVDFRCVDHTGRQAPMLQRTVHVVDTTCPMVNLRGPSLVQVEAGFPYVDEGAIALDNIDGDISSSIVTDGDTVNTAKAYYSRGSCYEILKEAQADPDPLKRVLPSGDYFITARVGTKAVRLQVWCDMVTDGGGYTMYPVRNGAKTRKQSDDDDCAAVGMQIAVPRTEGHFSSMIAKYGRDYFRFVPGIVGMEEGDYTAYAMKSSVAQVKSNWVAIDGGNWFIRNTKFTQPDGNPGTGGYQPGCWLGMDGWQEGDYKFLDSGCDFEVSSYVCSTNDKNGPGESPSDIGVGVVNNVEVSVYPPGAEKGKYVISYHVHDGAGNAECAAPTRTVVVKDTLPPVINVQLGAETVVKGQLVGPGGQAIDKVQVLDEQNNDNHAAAMAHAMSYLEGNNLETNAGLMAMGAAAQRQSAGWVIAGVASMVAGVALVVVQRARASRSQATATVAV